MASVGTKLTRPTSKLAEQISRILIEDYDTPDIVCHQTGRVIQANKNWDESSKLDPNSIGAHYKAFGFYYILCWGGQSQELYVSVVRERDQKIVGKIENPRELKLEVSSDAIF